MTARFHETVLNLAAHPLVWAMSRLARRIGPLWHVPGLGVMVSDAGIAREILTRDDEFTKNGPGSFARALTAALGPVALGNMDGEEHRRARALIAGVLSPERSESLLRGRAADLEPLRSRLAGGERVDLVQFTRGWSGRIAFDVLGIPPPAGREEEACHEIVRLSGRMASVLGFSEPSERQARNALLDCDRLAAVFRTGYEGPAAPSSLVDCLQSAGYTFEQAKGLLLIHVIGGTLTVSAALPRIVALLMDNGLFTGLAADPAAMPRAIDEGLRFVTPLPGTVRIAQRDTVVRGYQLQAGSRLIILTCNVARDANLFPDPDRFDIAREQNARAGRPWYGYGPHRCAGFNLAQGELKAILMAMVSAGPDFRIVRRRPAVGALLPAYESLFVQSPGPAG